MVPPEPLPRLSGLWPPARAGILKKEIAGHLRVKHGARVAYRNDKKDAICSLPKKVIPHRQAMSKHCPTKPWLCGGGAEGAKRSSEAQAQ